VVSGCALELDASSEEMEAAACDIGDPRSAGPDT